MTAAAPFPGLKKARKSGKRESGRSNFNESEAIHQVRIAMICIGSTGDVRPYIVLGRELKRRGHHVTITAFSDFEKTITDEGLGFHGLSGNVREYMGNIMKPGVNGVTYLNQVRNSLKDVVDPFMQDLEDATAECDCIIGTFFGQVIRSLAEMRRLPFIQTQYFVMDYNTEAPIASAPGQRMGKAWNAASYHLGYFLISTLEKYYLDDWRKEHGLPPRKLEKNASYEMNGHTIPVLYALSPLVMPRPADWGANIHMTGYWLADNPQEYTPEPGLQQFLSEGGKPIYVGFGSMVSGDMGETLEIVLEALRMSGIRAVLSKGWGGGDLPSNLPDNVYVAGFVPHDWLFKRVRAVVHHGGAGTLAAGLTAGLPTLVIPFGGDQPFWGDRVRALGVGPKPIPRERLTARKLSRALIELTSEKRYEVAARELGIRLESEDGAVNAANIIEHELRKYLRQEGLSPVLVRPEVQQ